jgi:hypothetical protein
LYFVHRDKKVVGVFVRFRAPLQPYLKPLDPEVPVKPLDQMFHALLPLPDDPLILHFHSDRLS